MGELGARYLLGLGTPPLSITHSRIEYMLKPNQDAYRFGNHYEINQYGMRSENFPAQKEAKEYRIIVFGDSVINGGALTDQKDLATSLVRGELTKRYEKATVGNVSAGSWGPGNWLAYAEEYGFFDADIIFLILSSHDYADNPTFQALNPSTHPTTRPVSALQEGIVNYLPRYLPFKSWGRVVEADRFGVEVTERDRLKGLEDLKKFLLIAKKQQKSIILLQHLEKLEIIEGAVHPGHLHIKTACSELGIFPISLEPYFRQSINSGTNPYRDNIHPNEIGQRLIADAILANLPS